MATGAEGDPGSLVAGDVREAVQHHRDGGHNDTDHDHDDNIKDDDDNNDDGVDENDKDVDDDDDDDGIDDNGKDVHDDYCDDDYDDNDDDVLTMLMTMRMLELTHSRATVQPGLTSIHTLFVMEHNRIAKSLWTKDSRDEEVYQRARMIVMAEIQNIVYSEFLPTVLGPEGMADLALPDDLAGNTDYNPDINPGIANEFATVAFRFGHTLVPNSLNVSRSPTERTESVHCPIKDNFFQSEPFVLGADLSGQAWENVLVGSSETESPTPDSLFSKSITDFLFCEDCGLSTGFGQDLIARNIQRGRDHGIPGWCIFRQFCGLSVPRGFNDRPEDISEETWDKIITVYRNVEEIDPFTGGMSEDPVPGGVVGPTFACIISKQFQNIRDGDRFFFTHSQDGASRGLSPALKEMVRRRTLTDILCDNIPVEELHTSAFNVQSEKVNCSERNQLDFSTLTLQLDLMLGKWYMRQ